MLCIPGNNDTDRTLFDQRKYEAVHHVAGILGRMQYLAEKMIHEIFRRKIVRTGVNDLKIVCTVEIFKKTKQFLFIAMRGDQAADLEQIEYGRKILRVLNAVQKKTVLFVSWIVRIEIVHDENI